MEKVNIEKIGKKEALEILENNTINRKPTRANIDFIKHEMTEGRFVINGASIVISKNGVLLDGQHRLIALSETNLSFDFIVVRDAKEEVFTSIDTGKNRSAGDTFSSLSITLANTKASSTKRIMEKLKQDRKTTRNGTVKLSNQEVLEFYKNNSKEIDEYVSLCNTLYCNENKIITPALSSAILFLLAREDKRKAISFIREVYRGEREQDSNAALTLRKRLINMKIDGFRLSDELARALFIVSFRAYKKNKDIKKIVVSKNKHEYRFKEDS